MRKALAASLSLLVVASALGPAAPRAFAQSVTATAGAPVVVGPSAIAGAAAGQSGTSPLGALSLASSLVPIRTLTAAPVVRARATAGEKPLTLTPLANAGNELARGVDPSLSLNALFQASRLAAPAAEPDLPFQEGRGSEPLQKDGGGEYLRFDSGVPSPGGPENRDNPFRRGVEWVKNLPQEAKVGATIAIVVVSLLGGFYHHAAALNQFWQKSKSASEVALIDEARAKGDAPTLATIAKTAHDRGDRMQTRIADAEKNKAKRVENGTHDTVKEGKRYLAFDRVVETRAELNGNAVTADPGKRIGVTAPQRWRETIAANEAEAKQTGFEGRLALILRNMSGEITAEETRAGELQQHVDRFGEVSPTLFGGAMKAQHEKGKADLEEFRKNEIGVERGMLTGANAAMRGRVSDRLYAEREDFKTHRDHGDRLSESYDRNVAPALASAREVDSELGSMISHRQSEAAMLALASLHTSDIETYTDSDGKTHTRTVDNSGPYRLMAATQASAAQAAAQRANAALARLRPQLSALQNDATIKSESLTNLLPHGAGVEVHGGHGVVFDVFLPPLFSLFSGLSNASSGEHARTQFAPILSSLDRVASTVAQRRDGERRWVDQRIDQDLSEQMAKAVAALQPEKQ
ncbi:MAG: hypothetical protein HY925_13780 [Elusimicrobia bacterium]|nr:hypothetical protein [Elusimicrobiota bacterium]